MTEPNNSKVEELEKRLETTQEVLARLIKAIDRMKASDSQFIFELDLAKHALVEAGYTEDLS